MANSVTADQLKEYLAKHRSEHPNLGDRSFSEIWKELPDQDPRFDGSDQSIADVLNELSYQEN